MAFAGHARRHIGTILNLPEGAGTATLEKAEDQLHRRRARRHPQVLGEATPIHRGRTTQVWQARVTTAEGRLVALDDADVVDGPAATIVDFVK